MLLSRSRLLKGAARAVVVGGVRTPFVNSFGTLIDSDSIDLGVASVAGLIKKFNLDPKHVDQLIWGNVVLQTSAPNISREIVIDLNLPKHIVGHSVSMACASGLKAILEAATYIEAGHSAVAIAGGSDSLSSAEVPLPRKLTRGGGAATFARGGIQKKLKLFLKHAGYPSARWMPTMPSIAERSTGKTMGWHADYMAGLAEVGRDQQIEWALQSHAKAVVARDKGYFAEEVVPVITGKKNVSVEKDDIIRDSIDRDKAMNAKPAFRKQDEGGTITGISSSARSDGGSAVLLMEESKAKELGYPTDVSVKGWSHAALDPFPNLLLAPAYGIARCLDKCGLTVDDIDLFEIHEAFAAQVLVTMKVLADPTWCQKELGRSSAVGQIDHGKVNVNGGSIAIGHPFAATGGRVVVSAANELRRSNKRYALVSICAAGGLGSVAILEHTPKAAAAAAADTR